MKKYYLYEGGAQQGPFDLEELKSKNIGSATPVWYESLADWTTAGQVEELKDIISHAPPVFHAPPPPPVVPEPEPVKPTAIIAPIAVAASSRHQPKSTAWLSWVLSLLVLGGTGYFIYQDMQKNNPSKVDTAQTDVLTNKTDTTNKQQVTSSSGPQQPAATTKEETTNADTASVPTAKTKDIIQTPETKTIVPVKTIEKPVQKNTADDKKKKAADELAAKEAEIRNHWPQYITFGKIDYKSHALSGVSAFDVPVYNATSVVLDKVTIRLDYIKSGGGVYKSETIEVNNIPAKSGLNGKGPSSSRGTSVNAYIIGIRSAKLHFCYPQNNGHANDPYYCK